MLPYLAQSMLDPKYYNFLMPFGAFGHERYK